MIFQAIYDALSFLGSFRWPIAQGEITAIDIERIEHSRGRDLFRLAVAYKFCVGVDGPYSGEAFWQPNFTLFNERARIKAARHKLHIGQPIQIRYRPDDPTVNVL